MNQYKFFGRLFCSLIALLTVALLTFQGCTKVDDSLGAEYIPNLQQMRIGYRSLKPCFDTRLYRTDSICTSNLGTSLMGSTISDTFGMRKAGFFSQFTWGSCPDSIDGFGYRPIFDSIMIALSVKKHSGDTTLVRTYEVYEIVEDSFITELSEDDDTLFYSNFNITPYLSAEPIFTFDFPDQKRGIYTTTPLVRMIPTESGEEFIERLMLLKGAYTENDLTGYYSPEDWVKNFKGIYVIPKYEATSREENSIFEMQLDQMGMMLYGRNRNEIDPTLIQDTTYSLYYFTDETKEYGNVSINTIEHDYSNSILKDYNFEEDAQERELVSTCFVEGMAGIVTELILTESFFVEIEEILATELDPNNVPYNSIAFNQARLSIYDQDVSYDLESGVIDWESFYPTDNFIERMDNSINRLGLYTSYKGEYLSGIEDYDYAVESNLGTTLSYDGYLNRSRGCYTMDISAHLQNVWNEYVDVRKSDKAATMQEALEKISKEWFNIFLAPEAYNLNTFNYTSVQGMASEGNTAPIKLEITYTLIK